MIVNSKKFPDDVKMKICEGVKVRKVNIEFKNGADIIAPDTNIRFIEPYKVLFTSKRTNPMRYLVALIFADETTNKPTIFINEIKQSNKCSLTRLIQVVNDNLV
jgi:hypothetical protein